MKYKAGDRVRIKSIDWYNENKDKYGYIDCGSRAFFTKMSNWCGKIATIKEICKTNCYRLEEYDFDWTDEMIEGLVEEEKSLCEGCCSLELKYNKLTIADNICTDKVEIILQDYELEKEGDKWFAVKKKKQYPKTYEECCKVLSLGEDGRLYTKGYKASLIQDFQKLLICRDAYWKIAGEEMGLGKPWEPQEGVIYCYMSGAPSYIRNIFPFPIEEIRDAFYENFKKEIEICKL